VNLYRLASKIFRTVGWFGDVDVNSRFSVIASRHDRFRSSSDTPRVFLTFDDGPTEKLTGWILDVLDTYGARATFFCLGRQVEQHPENYRAILDAGHAVGNHTYSHLNGWTTSNRKYFDDISRAGQLIDSRLFRPPYGRILPSQFFRLRKDYRIVFWDVLSRDYDVRQSSGKILNRLRKKVRPGSIVVFHDSLKAEANLKGVLPEFLKGLRLGGYEFHTLAVPQSK